MSDTLVYKTGKDKYKALPPNKYHIDRNTPIGDDADFYEIKPYGGLKPIQPLVFIREGRIDWYAYKVFDFEKKEWIPKNVPESLKIFLKEKFGL